MNPSYLPRLDDAAPSFDSGRANDISPGASSASTASVTRATAHIIALAELPPSVAVEGDPVIGDAGNPLLQVKARLQVSVGEVSITVGELLDAREHHVFVLDRGVDQPVDILLEGRVVARGQLVAVDDQFAVRLTELPIPLQP